MMRIVFFGGGAFGIPALRALAKECDIRRVICPPPRRAGRKLRPTSTAIAVAARELSLPLCESDWESAADSAKKIQTECRPDVVVVCDYGKILPPQMLQIAPRGAVNIHPSLLPRWRGAAPIPRAILAGDEVSGITIMQMDSGLDTGAILLQEKIAIPPAADCGKLREILSAVGARLLLRALRENPSPHPQNEDGACYAGKIRTAECALNFCESAESLARKVRAFSPIPGARAFWQDGQMLKIYAARAVSLAGAPGAILAADANGIVAGCGEGALAILRLQRAGRAAMDAAEFARGFRGNPPAFQSSPFAA